MQRRILVTLVILLGAYLRLQNLDWGLPEIFEEATPWRQAWGMWGFETGKFDFNPHFFNYPAFTFYIQWISQALAYLVGRVCGTFTSPRDMLAAFEADPYRFIYTGRLITSFFGIASIYLLYKIGKITVSAKAGIISALFLALNFFHIRRGQLITTDTPLVFFILLALIPVWKIANHGSRKHYIWAGIFVGLATGVKYPGVLVAASIIAAHLYHHLARKHTWRRIVFSSHIWMSAGIVVLVFFVVSPYCFLDYQGFYRDFHFEQTHMKLGHFGTPDRTIPYSRYLTSIIPGIMTWPLVLLALGGLGYGIWKYRKLSVVLLTFPAVYFGFVGSWKTAADHYIFPIVPFLLLFAALLVWKAIDRLPFSRSQWLMGVAACLVVLPSVFRIHNFYTRPDTVDNRTLARQWIEENLEKGAAIAKEEYTPELDVKEYAVFELPLSTLYPENTEPFYDLLWYTDFDYIITSSEVYRRYKNEPANYPVHVLFYRDLDRYCTLIKQFDDASGSGPHIKIYRVGRPSGGLSDEEFPPDLLGTVIDSGDPEANTKLLSNLASVLSRKKKYPKATSLYRLALAVDSTMIKAWYNMGLTLGNQGKSDESEEAFRHALAVDSTYANSWIALGHLYSRSGEVERATEAYEQGLRYDPYRLDVIRILSELYIRGGNLDKAIGIAQRGLKLSGNNPEFHFLIGSTHLMKQDYDNAITSLRAAVDARPSEGKYVYYLAGAYYSNKDYTRASELAHRAEGLGYDASELIDMLRKVTPPDSR